jgi:3-dehydroquinate dehydratase/shikimate dehydrogenase
VEATHGERLIVSAHDFDGVPADLAERHRAICATGAAVTKLAITAHGLRDVARLAALARPAAGKQVLLAMGPPGLVTRIAPGRFGSAWTYAGDAWAPGQIPASRLRDEFRFGEISDRVALYGVAARPSGHSMSPVMHNAAFRAAGLDAVYVPLEALDARTCSTSPRRSTCAARASPSPSRPKVLPRCEPDAAARAAGAVNTLVRRDGRWLGATPTSPACSHRWQAASASRARGSRSWARAAPRARRPFACAGEGAIVTVCARRPEQAARSAGAAGWLRRCVPAARGQLGPADQHDAGRHATGDGRHADAGVAPGWPPRLRLDLQPARDAPVARRARGGLETLGGLDMLVAQAEAQFEIWTGQPPAPGVMRAAANRRLQTLMAPAQPAPTASRS